MKKDRYIMLLDGKTICYICGDYIGNIIKYSIQFKPKFHLKLKG